MRVIVTGASGFFGRRCLALLRAAQIETIAVVRDEAGWLPGAVVVSDLLADGAVRIVAAAGATHLLHLAWFAEPAQFWTHPDNVRWLAATTQLAHAFLAAGGRRIVGAGTCAEYRWDGERLSETSPLIPATLYGGTKAAAGVLLPPLAESMGASAAWVRPFYVFGRGEAPQRFVARALAATTAHPLVVIDPHRRLDYVDVDTVAAILVGLVCGEATGTFNAGSGRGVTALELIAAIETVLGRRIPMDVQPQQRAPDVVADMRRTHATVPGSEAPPLETALARLTA